MNLVQINWGQMCMYTPNSYSLALPQNPPSNAGDMGSIPGSGRSPGEGNGNPLQYSCLENPMDKRAWWAVVHMSTQSWTWLKQLSMHAGTHSGSISSETQVASSSLLCHPYVWFSLLWSQNSWSISALWIQVPGRKKEEGARGAIGCSRSNFHW